MKILGTGLSGLIGSRITEILSGFEFTSISRANGVDVTSIESLKPHFENFEGEWVLHMAAKADVDGCENDKELGEDGDAWKINVIGTKNVAELCEKHQKKLIYISTDFVFDGGKEKGLSYTEEDRPNPINWYGETKYKGEEAVLDSGAESTILRIANPYGISTAQKQDFVRIIGRKLREGNKIKGVTDNIFVPTFIDDIANAIKLVIEKNYRGLMHAVGSTPLSPYDAVIKIADVVGADSTLVEEVTRAEYFENKAPRPFNLYLSNGKIESLGIKMKSFDEGIRETLKNF